jgi:Tol biopolymer transport system component
MELLNADNGMSPAWSPDGSRVAFLSNRLEGWDLYTMALDGSDVLQLTTGRSPERPAWSPDSASIVFERDRAIDVVPALGGEARTLMPDAGWGSAPAWAPDHSQLVFVHEGSLHLLNAEGLTSLDDVTPLTSGGADATPSWSPNGELIVFSRAGALWIVEVATGIEKRLTEGSEDVEPAWSPAGSAVVFVRGSELWLVDPKERTPRPLSGLPRPAGSPSWSPDGTRFIFHAHVDGNWEIFTAAADGSDLTQVTKATWISGRVD